MSRRFLPLIHQHQRVASHITKRYNSNKSPLQVFVDSIKEQVEKNREFQQNIKQLQDESTKLSESESLRRAKEMFEKEDTIQSEQLRKAKETLQKTAESVGQTVKDTLDDMADTRMAKAGKHVIGKTTETIGAAAEKIGDTVSQATEPLRKTQAYSSMRDQVKGLVKDDTARYIGYRTKDVRRQQLEEEKLSGGHVHARSVEINPEAGESVILHKDSAWKESWNKFKDGNPVMQSVFRMGQAYNESDHPVFRMTRAVTDRFQDTFGSWFEESENAKTIRIIRQTVEPNFNIEAFMKHAREYIVPEVLDAYLNGDAETLRLWCSEATYNVLTAGIQAQIQQGLVSDSRIMDLRNVEFIAAKLLENDIPVIVISFNTQEVIVFRDRKTGEVVYGKEDHVEQVTYACVLTKQEEDLGNPVTNGWRVMDMAKHGSRPVW